MPDGEPLSFLQNPAILRPDYWGAIALIEFVLVGDYPTWSSSGQTRMHQRVQWLRRGNVSERLPWVVGLSACSSRDGPVRYGRTVCGMSGSGSIGPMSFGGRVVVPSANGDPAAPPDTRSVYLRVGSTGISASDVRQVATDVQYASHVVNLVMPGFGDARVSSGTYGFDLETAAHAFFAYFADDYDSIAFIPQRSHMARFGAFHRNVKNEVAGIGKPLLDQSHAYGSAGRLQSVEVFAQGQFGTNESSSHEIAHQWGDGFDWAALGGIDRDGWHPSSHTPLLYRGATLIGAVLNGSRRVRNVESASFEIERTTDPIPSAAVVSNGPPAGLGGTGRSRVC